jgi:hypothetical protein
VQLRRVAVVLVLPAEERDGDHPGGIERGEKRRPQEAHPDETPHERVLALAPLEVLVRGGQDRVLA